MSLIKSWFRHGILRKGVTGQSNFWTILAIVQGMRWLKKKLGGKQETMVFGEPLLPGQKYTLDYAAPVKGRKTKREERILSSLRGTKSRTTKS